MSNSLKKEPTAVELPSLSKNTEAAGKEQSNMSATNRRPVDYESEERCR